MNGIDTNILIRLLAGDDVTQSKQAERFLKNFVFSQPAELPGEFFGGGDGVAVEFGGA